MTKTDLVLYNALSRKKEAFKPLKKGSLGLYTCGPTVYNYAHIGNLRTYIFEDVLKRVLVLRGYNVKHVMNITDVEDKIIREAHHAGKPIGEFTEPYEKAFYEDLKKLNIQKAWQYPKATEHIQEMIDLVARLLKKGLAYEADGSIYFDVSAFAPYGRLSRVERRALKPGRRADADEYAKEDVQDFAVWKAAREGEPSWEAPFGKGRPGWHIECSAMSMKYLGESFDIHGGGVDLIFPHHENEIAQSEGSTGKPFAQFFVEGEHLLVESEKMAKSLGNVLTLRDIEKKGFGPLDFRYLVLTAHYRSKLNFTWKSLEAAQRARRELNKFVAELPPPSKRDTKQTHSEAFENAIHDDLNIPKALGIVWKYIRSFRKAAHAGLQSRKQHTLLTMLWFDHVLGLRLNDAAGKKEEVPENIKMLLQKREALRKEKKWREADNARKELGALGWVVEDAPTGPRAKKDQ